jgi:acyl-coenzyme A thioesterase PaaI-like protein
MDYVQAHYPDGFAHCFGCGRLNAEGHHVKTRWVEGEGRATFEPRPHHIAMPGFVYGGLVASLIDCHSIGTAAAAAAEARGVDLRIEGAPRYVTGSLHVDFVKPTPLGPPLELRAWTVEIGERKVVVESELSAGGEVTARGRVVAVRLPVAMGG